MSKIEPIHRDPALNPETYLTTSGTEPTPVNPTAEAVNPVSASSKQELLGDRRGIAMNYDAESGTLVTQVVDRKTKEVVYQAPPDRIVELAKEMKRNGRRHIGDAESKR